MSERVEVFYNGSWRRVLDTRPGSVYIDCNGGMWAVAAGMPVRDYQPLRSLRGRDYIIDAEGRTRDAYSREEVSL